MRLVVTEKPSVARDLARVLGAGRRGDGFLQGDDVVVTWCIGHLLELEEPGAYDPKWKSWSLDVLPMLPDRFTLRVRESAADQWKVVARWLRDRSIVDVVNACDAGREGELIFRQVYEHAGCARPVLRFWVSSLTDEAIRAGWRALQPGARFDALAAAARSRSEADWLVGMNATRAMTCRTREAGGDALWSIGRVQTPTLAMIVGRDLQIEAFVPESYGRVDADLVAEPGGWRAAWFRAGHKVDKDKDDEGKDEAPREERLASKDDADAVAEAARGQHGAVAHASRRTRTEPPPLLYDLTELQRRANQRYGFPAQRTLDVAQALYERHKLITYPRTDARHLTSDQTAELPGILRAVGGLDVYRPFVDVLLARPLRVGKRLVDDAEVGDHHAIVPTGRVAEPGRLDPDEKRIYDLVARRLLAALSPDAVIDLAELIVEVPPKEGITLPSDVPSPLTFRARGRVVREAGWQAVDPPAKRKDVELPNVDVGAAVHVAEATASEGQTRPPRPHDDASLLRAMETAGKDLSDLELRRVMKQAGLGTPATRAAILSTLVGREYIVREGRALRSTPKGRALIAAVPAEALKSAELTGRWEQRLADVAEGGGDRDAFMGDVRAYATQVVDEIRATSLPEAALVRTPREEGPVLGACPACGTPVRARGKVYACDTGRACPFVVFAVMAKRKISAKMVKDLLASGRSEAVKGFRSKAGKDFEAGLAFADGKVTFWFPERRDDRNDRNDRNDRSDTADDRASAPKRTRQGVATRGRASSQAKAPTAVSALPPPPREGATCPTCGEGTVIRGRAALGCSRWREGCGFRTPLSD